MMFLTPLFNWLFSGGMAAIGQLGINIYKAKLDAESSVEIQTATLAAKSMELDAKESEIQGKLAIVEQGNWFTRWVRPMWSAPFVLYTWKVIVWDNMLQAWTHGNTDMLNPWMAGLGMVIACAYFGGRSYEIGTRIKSLRAGVTGK